VIGPDGTVSTAPAPPKPPQKKVFRPAQTAPANSVRDFFGFGTAPRQLAPPAAAPRPPTNNVPRPPANVGRAAEVPGNFTR
jgi:hypothetical protein